MKIKNLITVLLSVVLVFGFSSAMAKTIKWSMQGDSLTLDPHAQNEGPTTQVSRQIYEALVEKSCRYENSASFSKKLENNRPKHLDFLLYDKMLNFLMVQK